MHKLATYKLRVSSFWVLFGLVFNTLSAQTNISGVINKYAAVNIINFCTNKVTVNSTTGFSVGQRVMIIQMKGAEINASNTAAFGDIIDYHGCGNYEINEILTIVGNVIEFKYALVRDYQASGSVQLVSLEEYTDAVVSAPLTAQAWDGSTGGVLLLKTNTLTLNDSITVRGKGFRGAIKENDNAAQACFNNGVGGATDYYCSTVHCGAPKGEGIGTTGYGYGRGKNGNGGGGGDDHNTGGGGGSNFGIGGRGGTRSNVSNNSCPGPAPGVGGGALTYSTGTNKIFMGGGGGAGDGNNNEETGGANGGGIVILMAGTITGNNKKINANGSRVDSLPYMNSTIARSDGAGGGGGGGTVLLYADNYNTNLRVDAVGGDGGWLDNGGSNTFCMGPGGGGGAGVLWVKGNSVPGNITLKDTGGINGMDVFFPGPAACPYGTTNGAQPGDDGNSLTNLSILVDTVPFVPLVATACCDTTVCPGEIITLTVTDTASFPPSIAWSTGEHTNTIHPQIFNTTTFVVTVIDTHACQVQRSLVATVLNTLPNATICCDTAVCPGGIVSFNVTVSPPATLTYNWSTGETTAGIVKQVFNSQVFNVTVTDANGCTVQKSGTATVNNNAPTLTVCCDTTVCAGSSVILTASSPAQVTYHWSSGQTAATIIIPVSANTVFIVTATDANGCTAQGSASVAVSNNAPPLTVCCDTTVCPGSSVNLSASSPVQVTYLWSSGQTSAFIIIPVSTATIFAVTATDANGCTASGSAAVTINNNAPPVTVCCDTAVCMGNSVNLTATSPVPVTYSWSSGQTTASIIQPVSSATTFTVSVTDASGCTAEGSVAVNINNAGPPLTVCCDTFVCPGSPVTMTAISTAPVTYQWSTGQTAASITPTVSSPTTFVVTVTDGGGCQAIGSANGFILTSNVTITAVPDTSILLGQTVQLTASGDPALYTYQWAPAAGLNNANVYNPIATPDATTNYCVTVTSDVSCSASACYAIDIVLPDIKVPDAFTPNLDGYNEDFTIFPIKQAEILETYIYNRWGEVVFHSTGSVFWDGKFHDQNQPNGQYVCKVTYGSALTPGKTNTIVKGFLLLR